MAALLEGCRFMPSTSPCPGMLGWQSRDSHYRNDNLVQECLGFNEAGRHANSTSTTPPDSPCQGMASHHIPNASPSVLLMNANQSGGIDFVSSLFA